MLLKRSSIKSYPINTLATTTDAAARAATGLSFYPFIVLLLEMEYNNVNVENQIQNLLKILHTNTIFWLGTLTTIREGR